MTDHRGDHAQRRHSDAMAIAGRITALVGGRVDVAPDALADPDVSVDSLLH